MDALRANRQETIYNLLPLYKIKKIKKKSPPHPPDASL
jgi:hypothetical protein